MVSLLTLCKPLVFQRSHCREPDPADGPGVRSTPWEWEGKENLGKGSGREREGKGSRKEGIREGEGTGKGRNGKGFKGREGRGQEGKRKG